MLRREFKLFRRLQFCGRLASVMSTSRLSIRSCPINIEFQNEFASRNASAIFDSEYSKFLPLPPTMFLYKLSLIAGTEMFTAICLSSTPWRYINWARLIRQTPFAP
jgi:hypothetical protein